MQVFNFLKGYKTYLVAVATAVYGVVAHHASVNTLAPYLLSGLGLAALRAAVAKVEAVIARIEAAVNSVEGKLPASVQAVVKPAVAKVEAEVASVEAKANKTVASK